MRTIFLLFLFILPALAFSQELRGKVTDQNGTGIPQVRVLVEGIQKGALTNSEGEYILEIETGTYTIHFRHLNFADQSLEVSIPMGRDFDVRLQAQDIQIDEVEIAIGKRDPAYAIMEQLIANKRNFVKQYDTYVRETYTQATLKTQNFRKPKQLNDRQLARKAKKDSLAFIKDSLAALADTLSVDSIASDSVFVGDSLLGERVALDSLSQDSSFAKSDTAVWDTMPKTTLFVESKATVYFAFPDKYKTVVHGYRDYQQGISGPEGVQVTVNVGGDGSPVADYRTELDNLYLFNLDVSDGEFNFYRNLVEVPRLTDRPMISPLHSTNWRIVYKYKLLETYYEDNRVHYRIQFWPRNEVGPYFKGEMIVVDGLWAIKRLEVEAMPAMLNYFVEFALVHQYSPQKNGRWILDEEKYNYKVKDGKTVYHGETITIHSEYILNQEFKRNFFRNEVRSTEKDAFEKDSSYWADFRPVELGLDNEVNELIRTQDSVVAYHSTPEYLAKADSAYNHLDWKDFLLNGITYRDRLHNMHYYMNPILEQIQPVGVGGYRHNLGGSVRKHWQRQKVLSVGGNLNLGIQNRDIRGNTRVTFLYNPRKIARAYVRIGNDYTIVTGNQTISNIICPGNFIQHQYIVVGNRFEIINGLYLDTRVNFAKRDNLEDVELQDYWTELCTNQDLRPSFDPYNEFRIRIRFEYTPFQKYQMEPYRKVILGSDWPTFSGEYRKAIPGVFNSAIDYDFVELGVKHEFMLGSLGTSRWKVTAGSFINADSIQITDLRYFRGSDFIFANPLENLQMLGRTQSTGNAYLQLSYLHDFGGALISKIPLLKYLPLQTTVGGSMLYLQDNSFWHNELYAGLQIPFRIKQQRFKVGGFYAASYTNDENRFDGRWKVGITFFNPIKNQWQY
ncbi:MAG: DUF5686 and carboxypeptidase regulatory-like domain-containing protein [Bacteroidia bacterium]